MKRKTANGVERTLSETFGEAFVRDLMDADIDALAYLSRTCIELIVLKHNHKTMILRGHDRVDPDFCPACNESKQHTHCG